MTTRPAKAARLLALVGLLAAPCWAGASASRGFPSQLSAIDLSARPGSTRVVLRFDAAPQLETREGAIPSQWRLELRNTTVAPSFERRLMTVDKPPVRFVRVAEDGFGNTRIIFDLDTDADVEPQVTLHRRSVVVEWRTAIQAPSDTAPPPVPQAAAGMRSPHVNNTEGLEKVSHEPPVRYQMPSSSGAVSPPRFLTLVDAGPSLPSAPDCCAPQPETGMEVLLAASQLPNRLIALPIQRFRLPGPATAHSPAPTALARPEGPLHGVGPLQPGGQEVLLAAVRKIPQPVLTERSDRNAGAFSVSAPNTLPSHGRQAAMGGNAPATVDSTVERFTGSPLSHTQPAAMDPPGLTGLGIAAPALDAAPPRFEEVLMAATPSPAPLIAPAPIIQPAKPSRPRRVREPLANLLVGQRVKIEGKNFQGRKLVADEIELIEEDDEFEVEGPITGLDLQSGTFSVGPARILLYKKTKFEGSDRKPREVSELRDQVRVKVKAKRMKDGFIKARTVRIYEKATDLDFEISAPIERISVRNSEIELLSMNIKVDGKTEYKNFSFVQGDYTDDGEGRRIRRDDDSQHPDPIRIGNVYLGGKVNMGLKSSRNLDLNITS